MSCFVHLIYFLAPSCICLVRKRKKKVQSQKVFFFATSQMTVGEAKRQQQQKKRTGKITRNTKSLFSSLISLDFNSEGHKHQTHQVSVHSNPKYSFGDGGACAVAIIFGKVTEKIHQEIQAFPFLHFSSANLLYSTQLHLF